jgi:hypothetical protein
LETKKLAVSKNSALSFSLSFFPLPQERILSKGFIMYNRITLIGTIVDHFKLIFDPFGERTLFFELHVSLPPDAPPTHWGLVYDLRGPGGAYPVGNEDVPIICRKPLLTERCFQSFHKGDLVCVEGRLVLTLLRSDADLVPLAEILASDVLLIHPKGGADD